MKGTKKLAWLGLLLVLPVLAQATTVTYSALTVRELGNFLMNLPTGFYAIAPAAAKNMMDTVDVFILDVREPNEFAGERIQGAVNIPIRDLPKRVGELRSPLALEPLRRLKELPRKPAASVFANPEDCGQSAAATALRQLEKELQP